MATVVITGGGRGIGLALVTEFARAHWNVITTVRDGESAQRVADLAKPIFPVDVRSDASVAGLKEILLGQSIDVLVNNAGIYGPADQLASTVNCEQFMNVLNVNVLGSLRVTQALLPNILRSKAGKVVFIGSNSGLTTDVRADRVAYRVSKAAMNKMCQSLATQLAPSGVSVGAIAPGWVRTDMGGASAPLSAEDSASGVRSIIEKMGADSTGRLWGIHGAPIAW